MHAATFLGWFAFYVVAMIAFGWRVSRRHRSNGDAWKPVAGRRATRPRKRRRRPGWCAAAEWGVTTGLSP